MDNMFASMSRISNFLVSLLFLQAIAFCEATASGENSVVPPPPSSFWVSECLVNAVSASCERHGWYLCSYIQLTYLPTPATEIKNSFSNRRYQRHRLGNRHPTLISRLHRPYLLPQPKRTCRSSLRMERPTRP